MTASQDTWELQPAAGPLAGEFDPPGDRITTHHALLLGALAVGAVQIKDALEGPDTIATRRVLAHLGVTFTTDADGWLVVARQASKLQRPEVELDCDGSPLCLTLCLGLLAGQKFPALLTGGPELERLDLQPLAELLVRMGAEVECLGGGGHGLPVRIKGQPLYPLVCDLPAEHGFFKDPLVLAALAGVGASRITTALPLPDHLERLLRFMGVRSSRDGETLNLAGEQKIQPRRLKIPGDLSAAAPFIVAAMLIPGSDLLIKQVGANPRRMGLFKVVSRLGDQIVRERDWQYGTEPVASLRVRHLLRIPAFSVAPNLSPYLGDEYALLVLLATQARGTSHIKGLAHLRRHTPDRLLLTAQVLREFGADVEVDPDGFTVHGPTPLHGAQVQCAGDWRVVLMAACAALIASGPSQLFGAGVIERYYPGMLAVLSGANETCVNLGM
jgi:3-phosphoshikimate 1-carboxyvinyltransferase